jgi:hypothetical protein
MQIVLVRVGADTGSGGIHSPLFRDGTFEYVPIPDRFRKKGVDLRTYGTTKGSKGIPLIGYFPERLRQKYRDQPIHFDPEFDSFTYGDPTSLKARLRLLAKGDLLVFYAGLKGWDFNCDPALYTIGFFSVLRAGFATDFSQAELRKAFRNNFHVRHEAVFKDQRDRLVLIKGDPMKSRLLQKATLISRLGNDRNGRPLHTLSPDAQQIFGHFDGRIGI